MIKPNYNIRIGSLTIDSRQLSAGAYPVEIVVDLRINRVNTARLALYVVAGAPAPGDPIEIELGVDTLQTVFTGSVQEVTKGLPTCTVYGRSSLATLVDTRVNKLYEKQKGGDIVADAAQLAGVGTASIESGLEYPVYVLGADRPLFEHILDLARHNGFDCYADRTDKMVWAGYAASAVHSFQFGVNIIEINLWEDTVSIGGVEVYGESPASLGQGAEASTWLTKQEVKGSAGSTSGQILRISQPALKDVDSASQAAQAIFEKMPKPKSGWLRGLGRAEAGLGEAVRISDLPDRSLDGTYKITGIRHVLSKVNGFTTTIDWAEA